MLNPRAVLPVVAIALGLPVAAHDVHVDTCSTGKDGRILQDLTRDSVGIDGSTPASRTPTRIRIQRES